MSATISIDDTIIKTTAETTLTQFFGYAALNINWDDNIVSTDLTFNSFDPCGAYVHSVID